MSVTEQHLSYRGDIQALVAWGKGIAFTTVHPDKLPSAVYRVELETLELQSLDLPCGGISLASTDQWQPDRELKSSGSLWVGGDDGKIYHAKGRAKKLDALKLELPAPATRLERLAESKLAALCDDHLVILDADKEEVLQVIDLSDKATAISADPTGQWIAIGTSKGDVAVYHSEESDDYQLSESDKLHEGVVSELLFEPEELRFLSAGADQKLLLTHARGKLEPEDRGRGNSHKDLVTALMHVTGDRFLSASRDRSCKTWARAGASRPATFDDAVPAVVDAAIANLHQRPHLVLAGEDNSVRLILVDAGGRFSAMTHRLYDGYERAAQLLRDKRVAERGEGIHALASYDDARSIEMLAKHIRNESDHELRFRAAELLAKATHPRAVKLLEPLLKHDDDRVRMQAFSGLQSKADADDLRPYDLAISSKQVNVGTAAVESMVPLAKKDDRALQLLVRALDKQPPEIRLTALLALEKVFPKKSSEPTMIAMKSGRADTRRFALIRAFQRDLLQDSRIDGTIRRAGEDDDADVRQTAFLVALLSRKDLADAIRSRDSDLHRLLSELENYQLQPNTKQQAKPKKATKPKAKKIQLVSDDYQPLLTAMSSRMVDTCLLGARCLALLGDARAFGTLLQMSREEDAAARVQVCRSLATLDDVRAIGRLETLIDDGSGEVRDAAYSALEQLNKAQPLDAAEVGLTCNFVEVRRRALKTLTTVMPKIKPKADQARARELMLRALNDGNETVCGEAFKALLGMRLDGSIEATLQFARQSARATVRREILTEAMAADKEEWARQLLVELLSDPSPQIRSDAYDHLLKKSKRGDIEPMLAGLASKHADIRIRATDSLVKLHTKAAYEALLIAVNDEDADVRTRAVKALIHVNDVDRLHQAMSSRYTDVRLQAACARALFHDEAAATALVQAATAEEPERDADRDQWKQEAIVAINGLGTLASDEFIAILLPMLHSKHAEIRKASASALARCARPEKADLLKESLQHEDPHVRFRIALGLVFCRESVALPLVFSDESAKVLDDKDLLMATVACGQQTEARLVGLLDGERSWIRRAAFLILAFRDWLAHDGTPTRILAALSAGDPRVRLAAAKAIEIFDQPEALSEVISQFVNDRGDEKTWQIEPETIRSLATFFQFATPHCQAQLVNVLECFDTSKDRDSSSSVVHSEPQGRWDFTWEVYSQRYADELTSAQQAAENNPLPKVSVSHEELAQLAFGTYVGLIREQGGYHDRGPRPSSESSIESVRQEAIRRLVRMAADDEEVTASSRPVLIQALSDPLQQVRMLAFAELETLGTSNEARAAAGIECGHTDLAVEALKLLTTSKGDEGIAVLKDVVATRTDELASEATTLLVKMTDVATAAAVALESAHDATRTLAVRLLAADYEKNSESKKQLVDAYQSRYLVIQREVAIALASQNDAQALPMLIEQLPLALGHHQRRVLRAAVALGDPKTADALLDALEADQEKSLDVSEVLSAVGLLRDPSVVPRLLTFMDKKELREDVVKNVCIISGYDQRCMDKFDEYPNRDWMKDQFPRHDTVLAQLLERCVELSLPELTKPFIDDARWSLTEAVDTALISLAVTPDEDLRLSIVNAIGWRFRKRSGPPDALLAALEHRDADTRFAAAVGLARGGRDDGIQILLSGVELMSDLRDRERGVKALGELADERALDMLLRLASDDTHALQQSAAEAIGHLSQTEKADEIFALLKRLSRPDGASVTEYAIIGLRWFNTPSAWDLIREQAREFIKSEDGFSTDVGVIIKQLGYNDDEATKSLLLELLKGFYPNAALPAAKRVFGEDSLEPDYAVLMSEDGYYKGSHLESTFHSLARVCERGDAARILEIMPNASCEEELGAALMARDPAPVEAAADALESPHGNVAMIAASIIGRAGDKKAAKPLGDVMMHWLEIWREAREEELRDPYYNSWSETTGTTALVRFAWVAGRTGVAKKQLLTLLDTHRDDARFAKVRRAAIEALANCKLNKTELAAIETSIDDDDPIIRRTAAEVLAEQDADRASERVEGFVSDRVSFRRVQRFDSVDTLSAVQAVADHPHYQPIALPQLVASKQTEQLGKIASSAEVVDSVRLGAIEGLARIADEKARELLIGIGNDDGTDEELRKAAWRGLRRAKRQQARETRS